MADTIYIDGNIH